MKPFRLIVKIKNNRLIRLREELGLKPSEIAEKIGIGYGVYLQYESLKQRAFNLETRQWIPSAMKIAEFHGASCEWLWPEEIQAIRARTLMLEANARELVGLPPSVALEGFEMRKALGGAAEQILTRYEIEVLACRFVADEPQTLAEIGKRRFVGQERVRQIQDRALEKLRQLPGKKSQMDDSVEVRQAKELLLLEREDR